MLRLQDFEIQAFHQTEFIKYLRRVRSAIHPKGRRMNFDHFSCGLLATYGIT
jgi:translation initiation factor IF-3